MKFTLSWLKDHLNTNASLSEITDALTAIGLEVEDVQDRSAIYAPFKVVHVLQAEKHPNADKLRVCQVQTETGTIQVVCGAPNARTGMKAVYAPEGSVVPANGMVLKKTKIRDVESNGMMVSFREMDLGDDHEGIIDLPADTPIGTTLSSLFGLDDPVIEINVTPNRADCAGIRGIARDLAAKGLGTLKPLNMPSLKTSGTSPVTVTIDPQSSCRHFVGRYIKGVSNKVSPQWLQNRLTAIGLRPISALVDITNYISYDLCRPLHVFDADKIKGNALNVRLAKDGEDFNGLNDKQYKLSNFMTVISDTESPEAVAGVMGGMKTSCTNDTINVFLEVAYFDSYHTAKTGRGLQINSDARYRFERGIDPLFTRPAADIATQMILDLCGGEATEVIEVGTAPYEARVISYEPALATKILGFEIDHAIQTKYLTAIGCEINQNGTTWNVTPPSFRHDITMPHDVVEEVARLVGFDAIPPVPVTRDGAIVQIAETARGTKIRNARAMLASRGLNETVTWSFMDDSQAQLFAPQNYPANALKISNPISSDLGQMRPSILPNLINAAQRNHDKGLGAVALFEIGPVFHGTDADQQPVIAAALRVGTGDKHWSGTSSRAVDIFDIKADLLAVLGASFANAPITREAPNYYHPGRSGAVRLGNKLVAYFGEIHPAILDQMKIDVTPIVAFEIFIDAIPDAKKKGSAKPMLELSSFQPISRDFAFVCPRGLESDQIVKTIRGVDRTLITKASIFDVYEGKGIADGHKSVAVAVTLQPMAQSLTDSDIDGVCQKIISAVQSKTGATLR
jgi:phenylalanyl-tRNA synthetase beta chain